MALSFRGGLNPSASLDDELKPLVAPTSGGVFCRETLNLPAGFHTLRAQLQLPESAAPILALKVSTTDGRVLTEARLDAAIPDAAAAADALTLSFLLPQAEKVVLEGTASSHAPRTFLRYVTQAPVAAYEGHEDRFRFHSNLDALDWAPRVVVFGSTAVCNANCFHCPTNKAYSRTQTRGVMDAALFERIVGELAEVGFKGIVMFGLFGEPLQDKLFAERMRIVRRLLPDSIIAPATNAALYDPDQHKEALALADDLAIHVEGATAEVYEASMRPLKAERVFPKVQQMIEDRFGKTVRVVTPVHRRNLHEVVALRDGWEAKGAGHTGFMALMNRAGQSPIFDDISLAPQATACGPDALRDLFIDWDGSVLACCQDFNRRVILGDLTRQSVREVMADRARRQMAEKLNDKRWNAIEICAGCRHDCEASVDEMVKTRLRIGDKTRWYQPLEFRISGSVALTDNVLRVSGRRHWRDRLFRRREPAPAAVIYGPYKPLSPGRYRIGFDLSDLVAEPESLLTFEVVCSDKTLEVRHMPPDQFRHPLEVDADIPDYGLLQFRVTAHGADFDFRGVSAIRLDEPSGH